MPFANFKIPQGMMTAAQKADLVHRTTDLLVSYFKEAARPHTMVLVDEVVDGGYGRGRGVRPRGPATPAGAAGAGVTLTDPSPGLSEIFARQDGRGPAGRGPDQAESEASPAA
ncbi:tautomerase family protein [Methylobacterium sp. NMS14P]|uniref:tautomerase family protein n=1 Tax=Methylobacterium sp. NMS14P TaxID=2894310 RepID=UPI003075F336